MNCVAIDDEPLALQLIKSYAQKAGELINITATFTDPVKAQEYLQENETDLLLLDIQMPDINGLQFYISLDNKPLVIFTTAFSQYAVEGFNLDAVDYLVKPFEYERFLKAITKASELIEYKQSREVNEGFLFVKHDYQWTKIYFKDIDLIEALDDYIKIYILPKPVLVHMSMKGVAEKLPASKFIRVHRSYIIPIEKITGWNKNNLFIGEQAIPVSSTYQKEVQEILQKKTE